MERDIETYFPLDLIDPGMRPSQFRQTLAKVLCKDTEATKADDDPRPLVCLVPGISGDEPALALFRASLTDALRLSVVEYPDWRAMARLGFRFESMVESAVSRMEAAMGNAAGPFRIAGYSFGGVVAIAAAAQLQRKGHE